jgi:WhiB family redox-sensing transcriptional regulator
MAPLAEEWSWRMSARCRGEDPSTFFHPEGERGHVRIERQQRAKAICADCVVAAECRNHALTFDEAFGVWGGMTEDERARYLNRRTRVAVDRST